MAVTYIAELEDKVREGNEAIEQRDIRFRFSLPFHQSLIGRVVE